MIELFRSASTGQETQVEPFEERCPPDKSLQYNLYTQRKREGGCYHEAFDASLSSSPALVLQKDIAGCVIAQMPG